MSADDPGSQRALALAVVFGVASVPWTYGFELSAQLPLWPSFIASATYFSTGGGLPGLGRGLAGNLAGALYAVAVLALVDALALGAVGLSLAVGAAMFAAGLHAFVDALSFAPAAFFGFATLFSVHAAGVHLAQAGTPGVLWATAASLAIGAAIGWVADLLAARASA
jgi:hypothetical protein